MSHLTPEQVEELAARPSASPGTNGHVDGCADCRKLVGSARARRQLLKGLKDVTLTEAAFRRVEARLASEPIPQGSSLFGFLRSGWALAAVAAVLVAAVVGPRLLTPPAPVGVAVVKVPQVPQKAFAVDPSLQWTAVLVEGAVRRNGSALAAGDVVKGQDVLDARLGRVVLAELDRGVKVELHGLAKMGGAAHVSLEDGTVAVDGAGQLLVEAAGAWVLGSDAAFVVSRAAAEVVIEVLRGQAQVGSSAAMTDSVTMKAPARLKLATPVKPPFTGVDAAPAPYPFPPLPKQPWAKLDLSDLPAGSTIDLAGQRSGVPASMLLAEGRHRVLVQVPGEGSRETWVQLVSGSDHTLKLPPKGIAQHKEEGEAPPPSEEAIADLQRALKDQRPKLRACYEKWLKANPLASGEVVLTLVVGKSGKVVGARVDDATIPRESVECLVRTGKRLVLPALGSEQEVEVPLSFTQGSGR